MQKKKPRKSSGSENVYHLPRRGDTPNPSNAYTRGTQPWSKRYDDISTGEVGQDEGYRTEADYVRDQTIAPEISGWRPGNPNASNPYSTGCFAGRGPKGYTRSDDRIREQVCDALLDHSDIDASEMEVTVEHGEVTVTGWVDGRPVKRLVEDTIAHLPGVREVHNHLRISPVGFPPAPKGGNARKSKDTAR